MGKRSWAVCVGVAAVAVVVGASLAGCTSEPGEGTASAVAAPEAGESTASAAPAGTWVQQYVSAGDVPVRWGDDSFPHIILTTYGSGSCPTVPATLDVVDASTVAVTLEPPPDRDCTTDLRPTSFAAEQPEGLDLSREITVLVEGSPAGTLDPLEG
ncbi:hypothetical protein [Herbiconiux liukaitaii]|uniref:hypothetical protein n=1 Tax=Herbiconiux liukaitaii TaxID=3342799 RepID=UPI0035B8BDBA